MGGIVETVAVVLALVALGATLWVLFSRERAARRRYRILSETATVSDAGGSLEETIEAICGILVPEFADFCMIDLFDQEGEVRRAGLRVSSSAGPGAEEGLAARRPSIPKRMIEGDHGTSLKPRFYERMTDRDLQGLADGPEDLEFLRGLGCRSAITVALNARGRVTGALTLGVAWSGRSYRGADAHFVWVLSGRVALALDNCGLFADLERAERARAEIAETLQRGLLPPPLPDIPGWSVAAMYRPAGSENEVGGDFYDAFRVADGWMLVIGDVTGRGARAASLTAVARYTLRTAASLTGDPVQALETLNRALFARGDSSLCSVVAMALSEDPAEPVRLAVAGHPLPLLLDGEQVAEVSDADPVLGAFADARWSLSHCALEPGQQLVVVTDGVLEAKGSGERFGEDRLRSELRGAKDPTQVLQRVEGSLQSFTQGALDDDVAVIVLSPAANARSSQATVPNLEVPMVEAHLELVERLYNAFNRRDSEGIVAICDERMEFFPYETAGAVGREAPYVGREGLREYLADAAQVWEELLVTASGVEQIGDQLLVRGRVFVRSRELGIRDMPAAWIWSVNDDRFVRGEVFPDPSAAEERFARLTVV